MRISKIIELHPKDKKLLFLEAAKEGISLKKYIERLVEDAAANVRAAEKPLKKKSVALIEEGSAIKIDKEQLAEEILEEVGKPEKKFDLSGTFMKDKEHPGVYSNGLCFEVRYYDKVDGITKEYYDTLKEAVAARENK